MRSTRNHLLRTTVAVLLAATAVSACGDDDNAGASGAIDYGALQAGVVVAMIPCLVLYVVLQRFYVSGLVAGAMRG